MRDKKKLKNAANRYDRQYKVWSEIVSRLSLTSRMALREALNLKSVDPVELELLRTAATSEEGV